MFNALKATIRSYIITALAQLVADEIANGGLTDADRSVIDAIIAT